MGVIAVAVLVAVIVVVRIDAANDEKARQEIQRAEHRLAH